MVECAVPAPLDEGQVEWVRSGNCTLDEDLTGANCTLDEDLTGANCTLDEKPAQRHTDITESAWTRRELTWKVHDLSALRAARS